MNNLGLALDGQGRYTEAEMHRQTLEPRMKVLGPVLQVVKNALKVIDGSSRATEATAFLAAYATNFSVFHATIGMNWRPIL